MTAPVVPEAAAADIVDLYDRRAADWIADRGHALTEPDTVWLDRFTAGLKPGDTVLDVGCGSGRPLAAALLEGGFRVTGVDSSARLIAHAERDLPPASLFWLTCGPWTWDGPSPAFWPGIACFTSRQRISASPFHAFWTMRRPVRW